MRQRNTTGKIKDVYRLVLEATDSITPEAWKNCIRHVIEQEEYYFQMDEKLLASQNKGEDLEDVEIGDLDKILASDIAYGHYINPTAAQPQTSASLPSETTPTEMNSFENILPGQSLLKINNPNHSSNTQCGNFRIFLSLRFCMKSILGFC